MSSSNQQGQAKKKWISKTPFRLEALVPLSIIFGLFYLYAITFFDFHLKKTMEWSLSFLNKAEVNIENVSTSLIQGRLIIENVEVTNREKPDENLVQLGRFDFHLNMYALLHARILIENSSLEDIGFYTPRRRPGRVLPIDGDAEDMSSRLRREVLAEVQDQYGGTLLADMAALVEGESLNLLTDEIESLMTARERVSELSDGVKSKQETWSQRVDEFEENHTSLKLKIESFSLDSSRPDRSLREIRTLLEDSKSQLNQIRDHRRTFRSDLEEVRQFPRQVDRFISDDINNIRSRMRIPSLDRESFAMAMFGRLFGDLVSQYVVYSEAAKKYMPPQRETEESTEQEVFVPRERFQGETFQFTRDGGYPLFWLKSAKISSSDANRAWSGRFEGRAENLTTSPEIIGEQGIVSLEGDLLEQGIEGFMAELRLHHHDKPFRQQFHLKAERFPARPLQLSQSDRLRLGFTAEYAQVEFEATNTMPEELDGSAEIDIRYTHRFLTPSFDIDSSSRSFERILNNSFSPLGEVSLEARAHGGIRNLRWRVQSNLASALEKGIQGEVRDRIRAEEKRVRNQVESMVEPIKSDLERQVNEFEVRYAQVLNSLNQEAERIESLAQNKVDRATSPVNQAREEVKDTVQEKLDDATDLLRRRLRR